MATHNHRHGVNGLFQLARQTDQYQRTVQGKCRHMEALNRGCMARVW